ncbi:MAG: dockerin type I repeat-containing protein [Ruminococcus sp.]|nr:dockerin type I repeat-containing protein [Ruminococcus sp.]
MIIKKILAQTLALTICAAVMPFRFSSSAGAVDNGGNEPVQSAEDTGTDNPEYIEHTITFLDFDGKVMKKLVLPEGTAIDYTSIDTEKLHSFPDKYTEKRFYMWDKSPETADEDMTLRALYQCATIALTKTPDTLRYAVHEGEVDLEGLSVSITITNQTPQLDENGQYKLVTAAPIEIGKSCVATPSSLTEAFKDGNTAADIQIYPIGETKPIASYTIHLVENLGDINGNGRTDALDASALMRKFADLSEENADSASKDILLIGDINGDGKITAVDASYILKYYAAVSADSALTWNDIIKIK